MSAGPNSTIRLMLALVAGILSATVLQAQDPSASSLAAKLETHFRPAKIGTGMNSSDAATVLAIQMEGIPGVPPASVLISPASHKVAHRKDAIARAFAVANGAKKTLEQSQGEPKASGFLTNDDIIKLAQAKLPDSVLLAKIKSSTCDFDTSADALIKLKRAGVSDAVLQAMVEAPAPPPPVDPGPPGPAQPACSDYYACISSGNAALGSAQWDDAIASFGIAKTLDPSKPDAWAGLGNAHLGASRIEQAAAMWDNALRLGGPLIFVVCTPRAVGGCRADRGDRGDLSFGPNLVSFTRPSGKTEFAVSPSGVSSAGVSQRSVGTLPLAVNELQLSVKGAKRFHFFFVPFGSECGTEETSYCNDEQSVAQQFAVFHYLSKAIPKLASGGIVASPPGQR